MFFFILSDKTNNHITIYQRTDITAVQGETSDITTLQRYQSSVATVCNALQDDDVSTKDKFSLLAKTVAVGEKVMRNQQEEIEEWKERSEKAERKAEENGKLHELGIKKK